VGRRPTSRANVVVDFLITLKRRNVLHVVTAQQQPHVSIIGTRKTDSLVREDFIFFNKKN